MLPETSNRRRLIKPASFSCDCGSKDTNGVFTKKHRHANTVVMQKKKIIRDRVQDSTRERLQGIKKESSRSSVGKLRLGDHMWPLPNNKSLKLKVFFTS